jgi:putative hemolysin
MHIPSASRPLVDLSRGIPGTYLRFLLKPLLLWVETWLGIRTLNAIHSGAAARCRLQGLSFWRACVQEMALRLETRPSDLLRVPLQGPVVVVANHPYGATEAILLMDMLSSIRSDVKVLGNRLLSRMPETSGSVIPVEVWAGSASARKNAGAVKEALRWLKQGGMLLVFPAGAVSHLHVSSMTVTDPAWSSMAVALADKSSAEMLPIHICGRNRWGFQLAGLLHPILRTLLLAQEMKSQLGGTTYGIIGRPVSAERLRKCGGYKEATEMMRLQVYGLQGRSHDWAGKEPKGLTNAPGMQLIEPLDTQAMASEINRLGNQSLMVTQGAWEVYAVESAQIPTISREIARLRELTFRSVGEGTGQAADWDAFDAYYLHIFLWDREARCVVGAYRVGRADWILDEMGVEGLYSRSLFRYHASFVRGMGHALELGRSFIRPEYQKQVSVLALLWRGIGEWVARHPRHHVLFGPVSISREYHEISRNLLVQFLTQRSGEKSRRAFIRPTHPHRAVWTPGVGLDRSVTRLSSIDDVSAVISQIEEDGKGVPVLLRHYLKMNAQLIGFNVDSAFSNVLDGLVVVDLRNTDARLLERFMGREGSARFNRFHQDAMQVA